MIKRFLRRFGRTLCLAVVVIGGLSTTGCLFIPFGHHHHHHHDWDGGGWGHGGYDGGGWDRHRHGHYDGW